MFPFNNCDIEGEDDDGDGDISSNIIHEINFKNESSNQIPIIKLTTIELDSKKRERRIEIDNNIESISQIHKRIKNQKQNYNQFLILNCNYQVINEEDDDIEILKSDDTVIGRGFFSEVRIGKFRQTKVAIKSITREQYLGISKTDMFLNELKIHSLLHHPNLVQLLGLWPKCKKNDFKDSMVIEWLDGGTLFEFIKLYPKLKDSPRLVIKIAMDITKGMLCMHRNNKRIIHGDLTSKNIMLIRPVDLYKDITPNDINCKITDFGLSRTLENEDQDQIPISTPGYAPYMAPEIINNLEITEKCDIYSFSMVLFEMLTSTRPHEQLETKITLEQKKIELGFQETKKLSFMFAQLAASKDMFRPKLPDSIPDKLKQLITQCWNSNPNQRPNFNQIFKTLELIENDFIQYDCNLFKIKQLQLQQQPSNY
eukprot:gene2844-3535_t